MKGTSYYVERAWFTGNTSMEIYKTYKYERDEQGSY